MPPQGRALVVREGLGMATCQGSAEEVTSNSNTQVLRSWIPDDAEITDPFDG